MNDHQKLKESESKEKGVSSLKYCDCIAIMIEDNRCQCQFTWARCCSKLLHGDLTVRYSVFIMTINC